MDIANWNAMDWVAVIGAAAWSPQILTWAYHYFARPKISIYPHPHTQVGYTTLGPIFNVTVALLSERKDIILNKISVRITHERGASHVFDWDGLSEDLSEIQNPLGPTMSIKKTFLPLVVRVLHTGVAQVFVRFQYKPFKVNFKKVFESALDKFQFLKKSGKLKTEGDIEGLASDKEFAEITKLFNSEFIWGAGQYTVEFIFHSSSAFAYKKIKYAFRLTQDDVDELKKNIESIKLDIIQNAKMEIIKNYKPTEINWIWKYPELQKKS